MNKRWRFAILMVLASTVELFAVQRGPRAQGGRASSQAEWPEAMASMQRMHAEMTAVEPSGNGDVDFAKLMLPHHEAAIEMARVQLKYGKDPQMRRLAQEIIVDQQSEIELMKLWLEQHDAKTPKVKSGEAVGKKEER